MRFAGTAPAGVCRNCRRRGARRCAATGERHPRALRGRTSSPPTPGPWRSRSRQPPRAVAARADGATTGGRCAGARGRARPREGPSPAGRRFGDGRHDHTARIQLEPQALPQKRAHGLEPIPGFPPVGREQQEVVHVAEIVPHAQTLLHEVVEGVEIDVGEELAGEAADRHAPPCPLGAVLYALASGVAAGPAVDRLLAGPAPGAIRRAPEASHARARGPVTGRALRCRLRTALAYGDPRPGGSTDGAIRSLAATEGRVTGVRPPGAPPATRGVPGPPLAAFPVSSPPPRSSASSRPRRPPAAAASVRATTPTPPARGGSRPRSPR
jgi:hypothetical protein